MGIVAFLLMICEVFLQKFRAKQRESNTGVDDADSFRNGLDLKLKSRQGRSGTLMEGDNIVASNASLASCL